MNPDLFIEQELGRYKYNKSLSEKDLLKILKNKQLPNDFIRKVMNRAKNKNLSIDIEDIYNFPDKYPNSPLFVKCIDCLEAENFDDSIGDTTNLIDIIDFDSRDKSFVDINNEIYISDVREKHVDLINKILSTNFRTRPQSSDLNDIKIGFGHIIGDTYFIEDDTYFTNMTAEEVVNDIKDYKKIYRYDRDNLTITRLARLLKEDFYRTAKVPNISTPNFSDNTCINIIGSSEFSYLLDETKYERIFNNNQGCKGFFSRQVPNYDGIKYPIIFYNEMYPFKEKGSNGNIYTILLSWMYDIDGKIMRDDEEFPEDKLKIRSAIVSKFDMTPQQLESSINSESGETISSGDAISSTFSSYEDAYIEAQKHINVS